MMSKSRVFFVIWSLIVVMFLSVIAEDPRIAAESHLRRDATCDEKALGFDNVAAIPPRPSPPLPTYWINLPESTDRRAEMVKYLKSESPKIGLGHHKRIIAVKPETRAYNLTKLEKPCKRNSPNDLAIIMSHLSAMRTAVYEKHGSSSSSSSSGGGGRLNRQQYAVILEDDVEFTFDVDLRKVVATAPKDWGILQLMTSNIEAIEELQEKYFASDGRDLWTLNHWTNTTGNGKYARYWGALGYIINKRAVKPFLDDVVSHDPATGLNSYKIVNSFNANDCKRTRQRPCVLANCLFSDTYVYAGAGPTYVFHLPLITSGKKASTSHETHVEAHTSAFKRIAELKEKIRAGNSHRGCTHSTAQRVRD